MSIIGMPTSSKYWKAGICLERQKETVKSYSVKLLGTDEAFRLACEQREEWEYQIIEAGERR